jgi:hypothetical protein
MLWPPRILTFLPGTRCINIQWCIKHQNFSMFIIVLEQHVSILIESSSGPSNDDSVRIETCCPNTIINTIKFCCVWLIHHCIFICVKHFGMANIKSYRTAIPAVAGPTALVFIQQKVRWSSPVTGLDRPTGFQEFDVLRFRDNDTVWW